MNLNNNEWLIENGILKEYRGYLKDVTIPNGVTTIGWGAFHNNNITSVIIPNSVTVIGDSAFWKNNLTSVIIPNSVTKIGDCAFSHNKITSVIIPNSVTVIGNFAFWKNNLKSVTIGEDTKINETSFDRKVKIIRKPKELTITVEKEETILDKLEKDRQKVLSLGKRN